MTRILLPALAAVVASVLALGAALAGEVEATIVTVDVEASEIELSDGERYRYPVDFFVDDLQPGQAVLAFFDEENGDKVLVDLQVLE